MPFAAMTPSRNCQYVYALNLLLCPIVTGCVQLPNLLFITRRELSGPLVRSHQENVKKNLSPLSSLILAYRGLNKLKYSVT
jgi:hypothetical protein